jgi:hypothetical protein
MEKVKVKILKNVMQWSIGDVVELDADKATDLCKVSRLSRGNGLFEDFQKAMLLSDWEAIKNKPVLHGGMTQGEMNALGMKNVVQTPPSAKLDKMLSVDGDEDGPKKKKKNMPSFSETRNE